MPTIVGALRLPQKIDWQYAMELLLTGERIDAGRAQEIGLAGWVVPPEELMDRARALADRLLAGAPLAQRAIKEMAMRARNLPPPRRSASARRCARSPWTPRTPPRVRPRPARDGPRRGAVGEDTTPVAARRLPAVGGSPMIWVHRSPQVRVVA